MTRRGKDNLSFPLILLKPSYHQTTFLDKTGRCKSSDCLSNILFDIVTGLRNRNFTNTMLYD
jgi:hypothetical protein